MIPLLCLTVLTLSFASGHALGAAPRPLDDNSHPSPFAWTQGQIEVQFNGESPSFHVVALNDSRIGLSVDVQGVAEVNHSGGLVAYAPFSSEGTQWNLSWTNVSGGLLVNLTGSVPVYAMQGTWNASELPEEFNNPLGNAAVVLTFHLQNSSGASGWTVKFDLSVQGWPWTSPSDQLGASISVEAESESHVSNGASGDNVTEGENSTGVPVATLSWGNSANVTYPSGATQVANVSATTHFTDDGTSSSVHLLFGGVAGGYSSLFYDPSVWLNALAFHGQGGLLAWALTPLGLGAILVGVAVVLVLTLTALKLRRQKPAMELSGTLPHCARCGGALTVSMGSGVRILKCASCEEPPHSGSSIAHIPAVAPPRPSDVSS